MNLNEIKLLFVSTVSPTVTLTGGSRVVADEPPTDLLLVKVTMERHLSRKDFEK
jgi:hypothetical protein